MTSNKWIAMIRTGFPGRGYVVLINVLLLGVATVHAREMDRLRVCSAKRCSSSRRSRW